MKTLTKYGILIVVFNRLYLVLVIGLHTRYGVQIPIYLDRGRKLIEYRLETCSTTTSIESYLPRQGPETHKRTCTHHQSNDLYSSQYTSARGRKLSVSFKLKSFHLVQLPINLARGRKLKVSSVLASHFLYSYLSTSRGAGNGWLKNSLLKRSIRYKNLSTSRGAGNLATQR